MKKEAWQQICGKKPAKSERDGSCKRQNAMLNTWHGGRKLGDVKLERGYRRMYGTEAAGLRFGVRSLRMARECRKERRPKRESDDGDAI